MSESREFRPGVKTARCLLTLQEGTNLPLRVVDVNNKPVTLSEGTPMCSL